MAISDRITSIEEHIKESYQELEGIGIDTTGVNKNLENIPKLIDGYWETLPKVTGEGTAITLDNTKEGKMKIVLKGNTSQEGTPTPETPQDIHVVSGDNEITIINKNLFHDYTDTYTLRGITLTKGENELILNGTYDKTYNGDYWLTKSINSTSYNDNIILLKANTTYSFKIEFVEGTMTGTPNCVLSSRNASDKTFAWNYRVIAKGTNGYQDTWTPTEDIYLSAIRFPVQPAMNFVCNNLKIRIQVEKSNTPTSYEAYQSKEYEVNLPVENLCNGENQSVYLNQASTSCGIASDNSGLYIEVTCGNYTISTTTTQTRYRVACSDVIPPSVGSATAYNGQNKDGTSNSITIDTTGHKYLIVNATDLSAIQIEKGTKANTYTTYGTTPIELCKIGDYQDKIYKQDEKWYLYKKIGKVVYNGTETWNSSSQTYPVFYIDGLEYLNVGFIPYSNYYLGVSRSNNAGAVASKGNFVISFLNSSSTYRVMLTDNRFTADSTGRTNFKNWLSTNNLEVYYLLLTPTTTEITDSTLISQLEAINGARSYTTQTNINQVNNDNVSILNATALSE